MNDSLDAQKGTTAQNSVTKPTRRRRHDYSPELADLICDRIAGARHCGKSVRTQPCRRDQLFLSGWKSTKILQGRTHWPDKYTLRISWTRSLKSRTTAATTRSIERDRTVRSTACSTLTVFDDPSCG